MKEKEEKAVSAGTLSEKTIGQKVSISGYLSPSRKGKVYLLSFEWYGKTVGTVEMKGKKLHFEGDADKSAKMFFDRLIFFIEAYIKERLYGGPRSHQVFISPAQLRAARSGSEFVMGFSELQVRTKGFLYKWFFQVRKIGDKFTIEIGKEG